LVLPPMDTIRMETMQMVVPFAEGGGAVFAHPLVPKYAAGSPQDDQRITRMVRQIRAAGGFGGSLPGDPPIGYLLKSRVPPDCELSPSCSDILCTTILSKQGPVYFFVNTSSREYEGACMFRSGRAPLLYDPSSGETRSVQTRQSTGSSMNVDLKLYAFFSPGLSLASAARR
jgi:hypothetical protein